MKHIFFLLFISANITTYAQTTWAENVAPILFNKCLSCHNSNGISGSKLNLEYYGPAFQNKGAIDFTTKNGIMPPWPADTNYNTLTGQHKRTLTISEKNTIQQWILDGALPGDTTKKPPVPVFPVDGDIADAPDDVLQIPVFTVDTSGLNDNDVYRCFVLPSGLTVDKFIRAIDFVPGNRNIVHHMALFYDTTGQGKVLDAQDPLPGYSSYGGAGFMGAEFIGGWVPGLENEYYPAGMGVKAHKNGDYILQIHYPRKEHGKLDSSYMKLYYTTNPNTRQILLTAPLMHTFSLVNGPLVIPADSVKVFKEEFQIPGITTSLISVIPHMHNIGVNIKSFGVSPQNDTTRYIRINHWDFNNQMNYKFQKLIKVEPFTTLHAEATFDNTLNNPRAPVPLRTIYAGEASDEEMMMVIFALTAYQSGDENIILDSTLYLSVDENAMKNEMEFYPNPSSGYLKIKIPDYSFTKAYGITLYDLTGKKVYEASLSHTNMELDCSFLKSGTYIIQFREDDKYVQQGRLVIN